MGGKERPRCENEFGCRVRITGQCQGICLLENQRECGATGEPNGPWEEEMWNLQVSRVKDNMLPYCACPSELEAALKIRPEKIVEEVQV